MKDATKDEPAPPSSPVHAGITNSEADAHYTDMLWGSGRPSFGRRRPTGPTTFISSTGTDAQRKCSPLSHPSCQKWTCPSRIFTVARVLPLHRKIRRDRWQYSQREAKLEAAYKEMDEAVDEVFGKSDEEEDIAISAKIVSRRHDHEDGMYMGVVGNEED
ncbi:hypothetical protein D1007_18662 [Hordeum vulgare]|nr:hypothetical protein D1007_18662 [Hordeum vulgare]